MARAHDIIRLGKWSAQGLERLLRASSVTRDPGLKIAAISEEFLGVPYTASTLAGDCETEETLVINLEVIDCFTFLDYIEAMRISLGFAEFSANLARVRYSEGVISYGRRNHFFTDWIGSNAGLVYDATEEIGGGKAQRAFKTLNARNDGSLFLPGIAPKERDITYIPSGTIDADHLNTGDYIGIYTAEPGLDVSHVGIFIRDDAGTYLRHASSAQDTQRVTDQPFIPYIQAKPGIVVLRPLPFHQ